MKKPNDRMMLVYYWILDLYNKTRTSTLTRMGIHSEYLLKAAFSSV